MMYFGSKLLSVNEMQWYDLSCLNLSGLIYDNTVVICSKLFMVD